MSTILELLGPSHPVIVEPEYPPKGASIDERFEVFHKANPHVYAELARLARRLTKKGHKRLGIGMLWEVLRYSAMATQDPTGNFKLNNDYRSRYARMIMDRESDLADVFEVRKLQSA